MYPHSFSTVLEVDYDTPYDRHVIIEESHIKRYQKKKNSKTNLEEPPGAGLGSRILRYRFIVHKFYISYKDVTRYDYMRRLW